MMQQDGFRFFQKSNFFINFKFISNLFLEEDVLPYVEDLENNPRNFKIMKIIGEHIKKDSDPIMCCYSL